MENHEPKISLVEIIFVFPYVLLIDILEIVLTLLAIDDFWILDILTSPVLGYLYVKNVNATRQLVTYVLELIPYVGNLPLLTIGFLLIVFFDRHPKLEAAAGAGARFAKAGLGTPAAGARGTLRPQEGAPAGFRPSPSPRLQLATAGGAPAEVEAGAPPVPSEAGEAQSPAPSETEGTPPRKEISEEAFGMRKEPIEEVKELFQKPPREKENVILNGNEVNLNGSEEKKKAA
jgi:hypothetical protein